MRAAFELLESLCDEGWIGVYGTATWDGYRVPPDAREHLSLRTLAALAREVGGESHRFRVVQAPYNVVMPEAALAETQEGARRTTRPRRRRRGPSGLRGGSRSSRRPRTWASPRSPAPH